MNVISLGAGVQSSVMALMAAHGEITPMPDCAIFADTQAEPQHVYDWLDWLETQLPFPVYRVTAGNLKEDLLSGDRVATPPFFTSGGGLLWRQCTQDYKIAPIRKKLRELVNPKRGEKEILVTQWMGISQDEIQRMKDSNDKWIKNRFPLIEYRLTRLHCLEWMRGKGYNQLPAKSACTFCPYHDNQSWRKMKVEDPASWLDACLMDSKIRDTIPKLNDRAYVHRSLVPLSEADLSDPAENQVTMSFMDECDGMCGV